MNKLLIFLLSLLAVSLEAATITNWGAQFPTAAPAGGDVILMQKGGVTYYFTPNQLAANIATNAQGGIANKIANLNGVGSNTTFYTAVSAVGTNSLLRFGSGPLAASTTEYGAYLSVTGSTTRTVTRTLQVDLLLDDNAGNSSSAATAFWANALTSGSDEWNHMVAVQGYATHGGSGTLGSLYGGNFYIFNTGGGILNNSYGAYIASPSVGTGISNTFGLWIGDHGVGTISGYSIYAGNGTARFGGPVTATKIIAGLVASDGGSMLQAEGVPHAAFGLANFRDTTAMASNVGGNLVLSGKYTSGGAFAGYGRISGNKDNATDGNYAGHLTFAAQNGTALTDYAWLTSAGDLGLGTPTPLAKFEIVKSSSAAVGSLATTSGLLIRSGPTDASLFAGADAANDIAYFQTANLGSGFSFNLILQPLAGNLGIATITPRDKLEVAGGIIISNTGSGLKIGPGNATLTNTLYASATLDFPSTVAGTVSDLPITVAGAADGDIIALGEPSGSIGPLTGVYNAWASNGVVYVRFANNNLVTAQDPASGTFKVRVDKFQ